MRKVARFVYLFLFISGLLVSFSSCGSSNSDDETPSVTTPTTDGNNLQPEDQKQKLENVGLALSNEIKPVEYEQAVKALDDFSSLSSNSTFTSASLRSASLSMRSVVTTSDLSEMVGMMRSISTTNNYYTNQYATYTFDGSKWVSSTNGNALVYKYSSQGQQAVITVKVSNEYYTFIEDGETLYVPKQLTYTLTLGLSTLMSYTLNVPTFNRVAGVMTMNDNLTVTSAGLTWASSADISSSHNTIQASIKRGSSTLVAASAELAGSNMTTGSTVDVHTLNKGIVKFNVLDKLYMTFECPNISEYSTKLEQLKDQFPEIDKYERDEQKHIYTWGYYRLEGYYKGLSDVSNQYVTGYLNYDNSSTQIAKLYFDYRYNVIVRNSTYQGEEYNPNTGLYDKINNNYISYFDDSDMLPCIQFTSDGSKYKFADYFNKTNFASFVNAFEDLGTKFDGMLK